MRILLVVLLIGSGIYWAQASETVEGAKKDLQKIKAQMSTQLDAVGKDLKVLKKKVGEKTSATKEKTVQELEERRQQLKAELNEQSENGKSNWQNFKTKFAKALDDLNQKVQKALND